MGRTLNCSNNTCIILVKKIAGMLFSGKRIVLFFVLKVRIDNSSQVILLPVPEACRLET